MDDDDIEIFRAAHQLLERHGRNAHAYAAKLAVKAKAEKTAEAVRFWSRVAAALAPRSN